MLLVLIIPNVKVNALEDSFYEGEYISGAYLKKFKSGATSGKYQQMRVFRRSSDDNVVYCIELWEALRSNVNLTGYSSKQASHANIDLNTWEKIMLISYYGYGYGDHTDIKWYAITQFMIWKVTSPDSNIYFTDTLNGNKITKYEEEMNEINQLVNNHGVLPSFSNGNYELSYNKSFTLTDNNGVLDRFDIVGYSNMKIKKTGNKLTVTKTKPGMSTLSFLNSSNLYDRNPVVYIDDSGQDVLLPGDYSDVNAAAYFYLYSSTITVTKKDLDNNSSVSQGDAKLAGAKIQLLDLNKKLVQEKSVGLDSKIIFEDVPYGNYYLKEVSAGEGYLLNDELVSIKVDSDSEKIDFYNEVIENKIIFNKYLSSDLTDDVKSEEGAIFTIFNSSNDEVITFTTDVDGYYETILPYGKYMVRQIFGKKNYSYVDDFIIDVSVDGKIQTFDLYNEEITANVKLINTDSDSNLPILESGAVFKVINTDTSEVVVDNLMTDNLGNTNIITLASGKYCIKQIGTVNGYQINEKVYEFEVSDEVDFKLVDDNNYLEILIPNEKLKTRIEIEKIIEYYLNDELLKTENDINIEIPVYAKSDIYSKDGVKVYSKDEEVDVIKLVDDKVISSDLMFGLYYFKSPTDDVLIEIVLDSLETKKIELVDRVFDYNEVVEEKVDEDIIKEESTVETVDKNIIDNSLVIKVPNTFSYASIFHNISGLLISIGLIIVGNKSYEDN